MEPSGERRRACDRREQVDRADLDAPLTILCSRQCPFPDLVCYLLDLIQEIGLKMGADLLHLMAAERFWQLGMR
jgi:hypothetical protein